MPIVNITEEQRFDLLVSAMSGGINYWAYFGEDLWKIVDGVQKPSKNLCIEDRVWEAIKAGKELPIRDAESIDEDEDSEGEILGYISLKSIEEGEQIMANKYAWHLADIIEENADAITADVWFQCAVLKEIVYS
jgi:hypothetical protein